ncbi:MAG: metallophosphoesterase family protein [Armatimonadia bacterium]
MKSSLLAKLLIAGCAVALVFLVQAAPETPSGQKPAQGQQRGPAQNLPPCFRTEVPAHPFDIILGRPTDHSGTASVLSYADGEAYVEWGTGQGSYSGRTQVVRLVAGEPREIVLQPLSPDTQYFYRLRYRNGTGEFAASDEYRFHTQRKAGDPFTFTIQADSHLDERTDTNLYTTTLRNALADSPDFSVDLGDTFMCDKVRPLGQPILGMHLAQRYYLGLLSASAPLFYVIGNHDGETGNQDPEAVALRQKYLPNPLPDGTYSGNDSERRGNYYAWTWGDALFIVLDPFAYTTGRIRTADDNWSRTLGETQYRWLARTLESSRTPLKFVFIHHLVGGLDKNGRGGAEAAPYFEWGGHCLDGSERFAAMRPGWGLPIHQLLVKHGVSVVFHGHDHLYARQELDGVVYQEVPQPGWVGGERVNEAANYGYASGQIIASSGHLRVQVGPTGATVSYVRSYLPANETGGRKNGQIGYSYEVKARQ